MVLFAASITIQEVQAMVFRSDDKGQGLVEYALIMMLVALIIIVVLALLGPAVGNLYSQVVPRI